MEKKKERIILGIVLTTLMIVAIAIVIINPNRKENTLNLIENIQNEPENVEIQNKDISQLNNEEERKQSTTIGGTFCKIDNKVVFYEDKDKSIYLNDINENNVTKIATMESEINKIYFDGNYIYYLPNYYSDKGIYRIDLQGNIEKIYEEATLQICLKDEKIYFVKQIGYDETNGNPQGNICYMDKDGKNITELAYNIKDYFHIQNDKIYYTNQDRKMYVINTDGQNEKELTQGRKFITNISDKYVIYTDYSNQEAKHILNLEKQEDNLIGYYGETKEYQGKQYICAKIRLDDGALDTNYTIFDITTDGKIKTIIRVEEISYDLKYIANEKAYFSDQNRICTIQQENGEKKDAEEYNECRYFLGGYGYKIDDSNIENIKIERIELK